jgi:CRISPR-associated Csx2 family protein
MRRVYLSFLGTTNYFACNYCQEGYPDVKNVRFVQEATVLWYCKDWQEQDAIIIFTTDDAHARNWVDGGHRTSDDTVSEQGLGSRLAQVGTRAKVRKIGISAGKNEDEIWEIFSCILDQVGDGDELYLDITHAFRSLPLLAVVIINYLKVVKGVNVKAIGYGAMEAVGTPADIKKLAIEERNIPVFDLLSFDRLLDWSTAIDRFIGTGDSASIKKLTEEEINPLLRQTRGTDTGARSLRFLAKQLEAFSSTMTTCRGKRITQDAKKLNEALGQCFDQDLIRPLSPLLKRLQNAVSSFAGDEVRDGVAAARWCLEHNLIQQGFTLLQETMSTYVLLEITGEGASDKTQRSLVNKAVNIVSGNKQFNEWDPVAQKHRENTEKICGWMKDHDSFRKCLQDLTQNRNDLNHAGMREGFMSAEKFAENLSKYLKKFEEQLGQHPR